MGRGADVRAAPQHLRQSFVAIGRAAVTREHTNGVCNTFCQLLTSGLNFYLFKTPWRVLDARIARYKKIKTLLSDVVFFCKRATTEIVVTWIKNTLTTSNNNLSSMQFFQSQIFNNIFYIFINSFTFLYPRIIAIIDCYTEISLRKKRAKFSGFFLSFHHKAICVFFFSEHPFNIVAVSR